MNFPGFDLGLNIAQTIPAGKVRIYKDCNKTIPLVNNLSNKYVDLAPGIYNDVALQLNGLKDLVYGVKPGLNRVEIYKENNFSDTPYVVNPNSNSDYCLPELIKGRAKGIKITAAEGFGEICGFNLMEIVLMLVLLFIIYMLYSKYVTKI